MVFKAVLFDLDGTLLDTLGDLAAAANRVLADRGCPTHPTDAYRWFVGDGSALLITRALPPDQRAPETVAACLEALLEDYNRNWHLATRPYDGIEPLLDRLAERDLHMGVVTNKPHRFCRMMIDHYFPGRPLHPVLGQREGVPKKPDPTQALEAAKLLGVHPSECLFLGDSGVDMQTARRAGMMPIGAGWGFRPAQELIESGATQVIQHPLSLLNTLTT